MFSQNRWKNINPTTSGADFWDSGGWFLLRPPSSAPRGTRWKEVGGEHQAQTVSFCARCVSTDRRLVQGRLARAEKAVATIRRYAPGPCGTSPTKDKRACKILRISISTLKWTTTDPALFHFNTENNNIFAASKLSSSGLTHKDFVIFKIIYIYIYISISISLCLSLSMYIYIERERQRDIDIDIYIYIYIILNITKSLCVSPEELSLEAAKMLLFSVLKWKRAGSVVVHFNVEIEIRNILQALLSFVGDVPQGPGAYRRIVATAFSARARRPWTSRRSVETHRAQKETVCAWCSPPTSFQRVPRGAELGGRKRNQPPESQKSAPEVVGLMFFQRFCENTVKDKRACKDVASFYFNIEFVKQETRELAKMLRWLCLWRLGARCWFPATVFESFGTYCWQKWRSVGTYHWKSIGKCHRKSTMISEVSISGVQPFVPISREFTKGGLVKGGLAVQA